MSISHRYLKRNFEIIYNINTLYLTQTLGYFSPNNPPPQQKNFKFSSFFKNYLLNIIQNHAKISQKFDRLS